MRLAVLRSISRYEEEGWREREGLDLIGCSRTRTVYPVNSAVEILASRTGVCVQLCSCVVNRA